MAPIRTNSARVRAPHRVESSVTAVQATPYDIPNEQRRRQRRSRRDDLAIIEENWHCAATEWLPANLQPQEVCDGARRMLSEPAREVLKPTQWAAEFVAQLVELSEETRANLERAKVLIMVAVHERHKGRRDPGKAGVAEALVSDVERAVELAEEKGSWIWSKQFQTWQRF